MVRRHRWDPCYGWAVAAPLPNPERRWTARGELQAVERAEIVDRIGPFEGGLEVLGGGLANTSVRVGERVLRLFRRDPGAVGKEAWLLRRPWTHFRPPRLLEARDDFLLLEYVPHDGPITGSSAHGAAAGRALAESTRRGSPALASSAGTER